MDPVITQIPDDWTGERWVPGLWGAIAVEHLHRYSLAVSLTAGAKVLDVACGEGYGSAWMSRAARSVVGVDVDAHVVARARQRYCNVNLEFVCAHAGALPFPDASFDWVTCFETIEHLKDQTRLIAEIHRVLRSDGHLLLSSPDRQAYAALSEQKNPFHVNELSASELHALLEEKFAHQKWIGQSTGVFSSFTGVDEPHPDVWKAIELDRYAPERVQDLPRPAPIYWLVLAGALPYPHELTSVFLAAHAIHARTEEAQSTLTRPRWYRWGERLDFQRGGNAPLYQCHGWDEPTEGGTWTLGALARLQFDVCEPLGADYDLALTLTVQALVGLEHALARVDLQLNGFLLFSGSVGPQTTLTANLTAPEWKTVDRLVLDVTVFNPVSPQQLGQSNDARPLGLLWRQAALSRESRLSSDTRSA